MSVRAKKIIFSKMGIGQGTKPKSFFPFVAISVIGILAALVVLPSFSEDEVNAATA